MQAVAGGVQKKPLLKRLNNMREKILAKLRIQQKPQLDQRIKELEKKRIRTKRIIQTLFKGKGRSIGKAVGGLRRMGRSLSSMLGGWKRRIG